MRGKLSREEEGGRGRNDKGGSEGGEEEWGSGVLNRKGRSSSAVLVV